MNCRKLWNKGTPHLAVDAEKKQKAHPRADQNKRRTTMSTKMPAAPATSSTAGPWSLNYAILVTSVAKGMAKGGGSMPIYRITIEKVERHVFDVLAPDGMEAQRDVLDCTRNYGKLAQAPRC